MEIIIQNTWNEEEDKDLLDFIGEKAIVLSEEEILEKDIKKICVLFADTRIIQSLISHQKIPETYPLQIINYSTEE
jgi:hypothetical protein